MRVEKNDRNSQWSDATDGKKIKATKSNRQIDFFSSDFSTTIFTPNKLQRLVTIILLCRFSLLKTD